MGLNDLLPRKGVRVVSAYVAHVVVYNVGFTFYVFYGVPFLCIYYTVPPYRQGVYTSVWVVCYMCTLHFFIGITRNALT